MYIHNLVNRRHTDMIKKLPIRLKFVLIYINMTIFTVPILLVSHKAMRWINTAPSVEAGARVVSAFVWIYPLFILVYLAVTYIIGRKLTTNIAFPLQELAKTSREIAQGNIDVEITYDSADEIGLLSRELRQLLKAFRTQSDVLFAISKGDYTGSIAIRSEADTVNRAISDILQYNNTLFSSIRDSSTKVSDGAVQISHEAQTLASGSTEQAASIEQLSQSISQVMQQAENNTQIASKTLTDMRLAGDKMGQSVESMAAMTEAMQAISDSSQSISKVIKVIEDIAFQTNILALNAAVEAAHAGQHGKGFAVVAEEVRALASKSASAAQETADLIESSTQSVARGNEIAAETSESLGEVVKITASNAENMQQLSESSQRQSDAITEITDGIRQISIVIQSNTASAQESAASSAEMSMLASALTKEMSGFKLRGGKAPLPPTPEHEQSYLLAASGNAIDFGKY